ncbi:MAG: YdcF family protein [Alphaproteobacteria bacterium]
MTLDSRESRPERRGSPLGGLTRLLLALALAWLGGLIYFIHGLPRPGPDDGSRTDAIVVLTGGAERLEAGLALLAAERGQRLLISGVDPATTARDLEQLSGDKAAQFACCVDLGRAPDTVHNAEETALWVRQHGFESLRLVTANYHMPRALLLFQQTIPAVRVVPSPVFSGNVDLDGWWHDVYSAQVLANEFTKYLVSLLKARLADLG